MHHYEEHTYDYENAFRHNERELRLTYQKIREQHQELGQLRALVADLRASNEQPFNVGC
jgi:hypothetical protein